MAKLNTHLSPKFCSLSGRIVLHTLCSLTLTIYTQRSIILGYTSPISQSSNSHPPLPSQFSRNPTTFPIADTTSSTPVCLPCQHLCPPSGRRQPVSHRFPLVIHIRPQPLRIACDHMVLSYGKWFKAELSSLRPEYILLNPYI